ncbi:MAG TPA: cyclopropane-fatty-acyl-phospholipid synthase family protein [Candidatus Didemnitutus sp.]|nr:cyclopropane-fatty-acyl-phospholipid synthase family protein [Candidatus Didemnitutus sp.]
MDTELVSAAPVADSAHGASLAERLVLGSFAAMSRGRLRIELPDGRIRELGDPQARTGEVAPGVANPALIRVRRAAFFKKCLWGGDVGFAESFLDGDWETPDLTAVIGWFVLNVENAPTMSGSARARTWAVNLLRWGNRVGHLLRPNTRTTARRNIADHYDLSNDFFTLWLDPTMMYSSARWERADATLQEAQVAKNDALCRKLHLRRTDHVLEIGTGWGGWSLHAAQNYGCRVTTLTISEKQAELARARIAAAGLSDQVTVLLQDYRDVSGQFDKIVSIEMLEAVGHKYLIDYAAACSRLLKRDGLIALQFITCPDARYAHFRRGVDFIQKHIFPGSLLLSANRLNRLFAQKGGFVLHGLEDIGRDYARTLRTWRESFHRQLDQVRALGFDERFVRKWHYYLCYCEAAFALRNISVVQTVHTRPNNLAF